jgi:ABC-type sugar transport system ATPase subunit
MTTTTRSQPAIRATGLRKSFGDQVVLDGIDLQVAQGSVFALLGPNGAGKTTTVHVLTTLIGADGGEVRVAGHDVARDPDAVREVIGVTGQLTAVDNLLTGEENLLLMADLRHLGRREGRRRGRAAGPPARCLQQLQVQRLQRGAGVGAELLAQRAPVRLVPGQRRGRSHRRRLAAQQLAQDLLVPRALGEQVGERPGRLGVAAQPRQRQRAGAQQRPPGRRPFRPQLRERVVERAVAGGGPLPQRQARLGVGERRRVVAGARPVRWPTR